MGKHTDKDYVLGLEQALVQIRTMFDNKAIQQIVDSALSHEYDKDFYALFKKCFWTSIKEEFPRGSENATHAERESK